MEPGREDAYAVFLHEFRHLMKENRQLDPGELAYGMARAKGTTRELAIEIDADEFAVRLFKGECSCESQR
jgi:hypothetical protein